MTASKRSATVLLVGFALLVTMLVATMLELHWAMAPNFGIDEGCHTLQARIGPAWKAFFEWSADAHPMLYYLLLRPFAYLGKEAFYLRLLSVIPAVLTLPLVFGLLRKLRVHRGVALTVVVLLASAWSFLHVGAMVRAYALAVFFEVAGLWFWIELLPGSSRPPRRLSVVGALALFTAAFWTSYSAGFATAAIFGATLLPMLLNRDVRHTLVSTLRRYSGWPEWLVFFALHALALLWFKIGWIDHVGLSTPGYLGHFSLAPGEDVWTFLVANMRNETALFTPLFGLGDLALDIGSLLLLGAMLGLAFVYLRKGNVARGIVALSPFFLLAILATLALFHKFPFGGDLRHQFVLFPYLFLLLALVLELIWPRLPHPALKGLVVVLALTIGISTSVRSYNEFGGVSEAPATPLWETEFNAAFAQASDAPVFIPGYTFCPAYINRLEPGVWYLDSYIQGRSGFHSSIQSWVSILLPWPQFQEYGVVTDDGGRSTLIKDVQRMMFGAVPDDWFLSDMRGVLEDTGRRQGRVLAIEAGGSLEEDVSKLYAAAACSGVTVTRVETVGTAVLWSFKLGPEPDKASRDECHAGLDVVSTD